MATLSQKGYFYPGNVGFPSKFTLVDNSDPPLPLIPNQIALSDILSVELEIKRPNNSKFSLVIPWPGSWVNGTIQYITGAGDLPISGIYHYVLTLVLTNSRQMPIRGTFTVLP
jgi:hypothetical protein